MFDSSPVIVGLEIGTSKICAVVGEMTDTLAARLFGAQTNLAREEALVSALLDEAYGDILDGCWSSFTCDYYDESIEVYGVTPSQPALDKLSAAGFRRVWQHNHLEDDEHGEPAKFACACPANRVWCP